MVTISPRNCLSRPLCFCSTGGSRTHKTLSCQQFRKLWRSSITLYGARKTGLGKECPPSRQVKPPPVRDASLSKQLKQTIKHLCKNSSVVCLYIVYLCRHFVQCTFVNQSQCKYTELFFKSQGFRRKFLNFFIIYRKQAVYETNTLCSVMQI